MNQIRNNLGLQSELTSMNTSLMGTHQNSITSLSNTSTVTANARENANACNLAAQVQMAFNQENFD